MKKVNEGFVCRACQRSVSSACKTCRNHCPYCFVSLHVDDCQPGDRASDCGNMMVPTSYQTQGDQITIRFVCIACGATHRNKAAVDDKIAQLDGYIEGYKAMYASCVDR